VIIKNSRNRYGLISKWLHWLVAIMVLCLVPLGLYMTSLEDSPFKFEIYGLHKSFGTLVLAFMALRLIWRGVNDNPKLPKKYSAINAAFVKLVYILFYICLFVMPLSGWLMSSAGQHSYSFFGLFDMPEISGKNKALFELSRDVHEITAAIIVAVISLHVISIAKYKTIRRILPVKHGGALSYVVLTIVFMISTLSLLVLLTGDERDNGHETEISTQAPVHSHDHNHDHNYANIGDSSVKDVTKWVVNSSKSNIGFSAMVSGKIFTGEFNDFSGIVFFDPENPSSGRGVIKVKTSSVRSSDKEIDGYIVMRPWLFSESFPESILKINRFSGENGSYIAHGEIKLRGVTMKVEVPFIYSQGKDDHGNIMSDIQAEFSINRLEFGVGQGVWAEEKTASHKVDIFATLYSMAEK